MRLTLRLFILLILLTVATLVSPMSRAEEGGNCHETCDGNAAVCFYNCGQTNQACRNACQDAQIKCDKGCGPAVVESDN
ncbi:MAG: hypothetical protein QOK48_1738 [Blastocatellia bacterium]|jgi:hypothetical protein|nr:hypothetical protein [Blastocatellia bacterium]